MKTNLIFKTACLLSTFIWANAEAKQEQELLLCRNSTDAALYTLLYANQPHIARISHTNVSATVICPQGSEFVLKQKMTVKCYGSWAIDTDAQGNTVYDSLAWIEFINNGKTIKAKTQTSRYNGSVIHDLDCKVERVPDEGSTQ